MCIREERHYPGVRETGGGNMWGNWKIRKEGESEKKTEILTKKDKKRQTEEKKQHKKQR